MPSPRRRRRLRTSSPPAAGPTDADDGHDTAPIEAGAGTETRSGTELVGEVRQAGLGHLVVRPRQLAGEGILPAEGVRPDYTLLQRLGVGGLGEVHLAWQASLDRTVAIKRLRPEATGRDEDLLREAVVAAGLTHPHIVPVHDVARDPSGAPFYVMRPIEGRRWSEVLGRMSQRENVEILLRVCDAVAYAHAHGVLHRDLKPENVMVGDFNEVLLLDWSLAAAVPGAMASPAPALAETCEISGTPAYMAPEMALGDGARITVRSDVYLLGAILFEICTGKPPHDGENDREQMAAAVANRIRPTRQRSELLELALLAMATEPADRPAGVRELQAALRASERHGESRSLAGRATLALDRASVTGDYTFFDRALFGFEEALALWPGNEAARLGLGRTRRAYAMYALLRGDLDLAASLVDPQAPGQGDLAARLAAAQAQRAGERSAAEALVSAQANGNDERHWQTVCHETFTDASWAQRWELVGGTARTEGGALVIEAGAPMLLVHRLPVQGEVRLTWECTLLSDYLNDVSCFLGARLTARAQEIFGSGYEFKYGGYDNTAVCCYRAGRQLLHRPLRPLAKDRPFHVEACLAEGRIVLRIDGETVFDLADDAPLPRIDRDRAGLFGWGSTYRIRDLRIELRTVPLRVDPLELAETQLALGHHATAADLFAEAALTDDSTRAARAEEGLRRARSGTRAAGELAAARGRILAAWPQAQVELGPGGLTVSAPACGIRDLTPLAGMPIADLDLAGNPITDLAPLDGMPLTRLDISGCRVVDLAPLAGAPLERLEANNNRIVDLAPLAGMRLSGLDADANRIVDLAPLAGMPLTRLSLNGNQIADLVPLAAGLALQSLGLAGNRIADLAPLAGCRAEHLFLDDNPFTDLSPLAGVRPSRLTFSHTGVRNLDALAAMAPDFVACCDCRLADLGPWTLRPPRLLLTDGGGLDDAQIGRLADGWNGNPAWQDNLRLLRTALALHRRDREALFALGATVEGRRLLFLPVSLPYAEAHRLCCDLGGALVCPASRTLAEALTGIAPLRYVGLWLGRRAGAARWDDGHPVTYDHSAPLGPDDEGAPLALVHGLPWQPMRWPNRLSVVISWPDRA